MVRRADLRQAIAAMDKKEDLAKLQAKAKLSGKEIKDLGEAVYDQLGDEDKRFDILVAAQDKFGYEEDSEESQEIFLKKLESIMTEAAKNLLKGVGLDHTGKKWADAKAFEAVFKYLKDGVKAGMS